jgi:hypothetical protein
MTTSSFGQLESELLTKIPSLCYPRVVKSRGSFGASLALSFLGFLSRSGAAEIPIPLDQLEGLKIPPGEVSLILDPKGPVYLVNATRDAQAGLDHGLKEVFKEVKIEGRWHRCRSFEIEKCADIPIIPDLPAGHALAKATASWDSGDKEGEIRYCLTRLASPPLVSSAIQGRYSQAALEASSKDFFNYHGTLEEVLGSLREGHWGGASLAKGIGELAALLELERSYDRCVHLRRIVGDWLEKNPNGGGIASRTETEALRKALAKPWERSLDERNCFKTCLAALSQGTKGKHPVGSPARYPALIWAYLAKQPKLRGEPADSDYYQNPGRRAELERLKASGNRWGAEPEELKQIRILADRSMKSGNKREAEAAKWFLATLSQ